MSKSSARKPEAVLRELARYGRFLVDPLWPTPKRREERFKGLIAELRKSIRARELAAALKPSRGGR